jgi:hypothetical protein
MTVMPSSFYRSLLTASLMLLASPLEAGAAVRIAAFLFL